MKDYKTEVIYGILVKKFDDGKYGTLEWNNNEMKTIIHNNLEELKIFIKSNERNWL